MSSLWVHFNTVPTRDWWNPARHIVSAIVESWTCFSKFNCKFKQITQIKSQHISLYHHPLRIKVEIQHLKSSFRGWENSKHCFKKKKKKKKPILYIPPSTEKLQEKKPKRKQKMTWKKQNVHLFWLKYKQDEKPKNHLCFTYSNSLKYQTLLSQLAAAAAAGSCWALPLTRSRPTWGELGCTLLYTSLSAEWSSRSWRWLESRWARTRHRTRSLPPSSSSPSGWCLQPLQNRCCCSICN